MAKNTGNGEVESSFLSSSILLQNQQEALAELQDELHKLKDKHVSCSKSHKAKLDALSNQVASTHTYDQSEIISLLEEKLENLTKEKELLEMSASRSSAHMRKLKDHITLSGGPGMENLSDAVLPEYEKLVATLEDEIQRLQEKLSKSGDGRVIALKENVTLKSQVNKLEAEIQLKNDEMETLREEVLSHEKEVSEIRGSLITVQTQLRENREDFSSLTQQIETMKENKESQEGIIHGLRNRIGEAEGRIRQSLQIAEDAVVEKDAALLRERHALEEVQSLKVNMQSMLDDSNLKIKDEVARTKDEFGTCLDAMAEEISKLEVMISTKNAESEKKSKEVSRLENALSTSQKELIFVKEDEIKKVREYHKRILELESVVQTSIVEKQKLLEDINHDKDSLQSEIFLLTNHVAKLEQDLTKSRQEVVSLQQLLSASENEAMEVARQILLLSDEKMEMREQLNKVIQLKKESIEELLSSSKRRIAHLEKSYRESYNVLEASFSELLRKCESLEAELKEVRSLHKNEVRSLLDQLQHMNEKTEALQNLKHKAVLELEVTQESLKDYQNRVLEAENRLHSAESRFMELKGNQVWSDEDAMNKDYT